MIYEGVNFHEESIRKLDRQTFIKMHVDGFWKDRDEATREKMLGDAYDLIVKPKKAKKAE